MKEIEKSLAWKQYEADFNALSDEEIEDECRMCRDQVDEAESWLEAVAAWEAVGKPRRMAEDRIVSPSLGEEA